MAKFGMYILETFVASKKRGDKMPLHLLIGPLCSQIGKEMRHSRTKGSQTFFGCVIPLSLSVPLSASSANLALFYLRRQQIYQSSRMG